MKKPLLIITSIILVYCLSGCLYNTEENKTIVSALCQEFESYIVNEDTSSLNTLLPTDFIYRYDSENGAILTTYNKEEFLNAFEFAEEDWDPGIGNVASLEFRTDTPEISFFTATYGFWVDYDADAKTGDYFGHIELKCNFWGENWTIKKYIIDGFEPI